MITGVLLRWLVNSLVLFVISYVVPGVTVTGFEPALAMALVLGMINALLKPALIVLSLPLTILSLGFFTFVINGFLFWLAARIVQGYAVTGFLTAFLAALVFSFASLALGSFFK